MENLVRWYKFTFAVNAMLNLSTNTELNSNPSFFFFDQKKFLG